MGYMISWQNFGNLKSMDAILFWYNSHRSLVLAIIGNANNSGYEIVRNEGIAGRSLPSRLGCEPALTPVWFARKPSFHLACTSCVNRGEEEME
jgi:hypothetical protein